MPVLFTSFLSGEDFHPSVDSSGPERASLNLPVSLHSPLHHPWVRWETGLSERWAGRHSTDGPR